MKEPDTTAAMEKVSEFAYRYHLHAQSPTGLLAARARGAAGADIAEGSVGTSDG